MSYILSFLKLQFNSRSRELRNERVRDRFIVEMRRVLIQVLIRILIR